MSEEFGAENGLGSFINDESEMPSVDFFKEYQSWQSENEGSMDDYVAALTQDQEAAMRTWLEQNKEATYDGGTNRNLEQFWQKVSGRTMEFEIARAIARKK